MNGKRPADQVSCTVVLMTTWFDAVLFDLDGVTTNIVGIHASA